MTFKVHSLNISEKKGTKKLPVESVIFQENVGIPNDAHRGMKNRQISLLSVEEIKAFKSDLPMGSFGENLVTEGLDINTVKLLDRMVINPDIEIEVSKIGKKCHDRCHIYHEVGDCIMPKKGIFVRVLKGGTVKTGDTGTFIPKTFEARVFTLSDRASQGVYKDKSGDLLKQRLEDYFDKEGRNHTVTKEIIPDSEKELTRVMTESIKAEVDIIFTTGGTGISERDITIEVIQPFIKKELNGIMDFIRMKYGQKKVQALVSRSIAGVNKKTLIFSLPGSSKAVKEYLDEILPMLDHLIGMVHDLDNH
jgi:molybdopterin adenylyltransferase